MRFMQGRRYNVLDGYRGLAALAVLLYHATAFSALKTATHGYLAVDFFFLLSGFVVASAYEQRLRDGMRVSAFMKIRLIRLYPLAMLGVIVGTILLHRFYDGKSLAVLLITGLLFIPTPLGTPLLYRPIFGANLVAWSLLWELVANLFYAFSVRNLTNERLVACIVVAFAALLSVSVAYGSIDMGPLWSNLWGGPVRAAFPFLVGIGLYRLQLRRALPVGIRPKIGVPLLIVIFLLPHGDGTLPIDITVVTLIFPAIIVGGVTAEAGRWRSICDFAGALSYPAYILQGGCYPLIQLAAPAMQLHGLADVAVTAILILSYLALCVALLHFFDAPLQRYLRTCYRPERLTDDAIGELKKAS